METVPFPGGDGDGGDDSDVEDTDGTAGAPDGAGPVGGVAIAEVEGPPPALS
ncbi:hypothetical protein ABZ479_12010 [Streptomyces sp. NPDC005722]